MSNAIEIEAKVLLKKEDFYKVYDFIKANNSSKIIQINHYIDSDEQNLRKLGFALRIRQRENYIMTLKAPLSEGLLEKSQDITKEQYEAFKSTLVFPEGDIKNFLLILGLNVSQLHILTSLKTERVILPYKDGELSLDSNSYNGQEDFELEMEASSITNAEESLKEICDAASVTYTPNHNSKQYRAMNSLKKQF